MARNFSELRHGAQSRWDEARLALGATPPWFGIAVIAVTIFAELVALGPFVVEPSEASRGPKLAIVQAAFAGLAVIAILWALIMRRPSRREAGTAWAVVIVCAVAWLVLYLMRRAAGT